MSFNPGTLISGVATSVIHNQKVNRDNEEKVNSKVGVAPTVKRTTVVNKTIIYSDTVLPLKDIGDNLKVTSI